MPILVLKNGEVVPNRMKLFMRMLAAERRKLVKLALKSPYPNNWGQRVFSHLDQHAYESLLIGSLKFGGGELWYRTQKELKELKKSGI